jgi:hypothetical protein
LIVFENDCERVKLFINKHRENMKFIKKLCWLVALLISFSSCQKEFGIDGFPAEGSLVKNAANECNSNTAQGSYAAGIATNVNNFADVQVDITKIGQYEITTDTVNGYYFAAKGAVGQTGVQTIRLQATGTPTAASIDVFNVKFNNSICEINAIVTAAPALPATFTFNTTGTNCSATPAGLYQAGLATNANNWVDLAVDVTVAGSYNITASSTANNNISFSGTGTLPIGAGVVRLLASGTPSVQGNFNYTVSLGTSTCNFTIAYGAAAPVAVYSVPSCAAISASGTYTAGTAVTASNTINIPVIVNTTGTYSITATTTNGTLAFSGSGTLTAPAGLITLNATGIPANAGNLVVALQLAGSICSVNINVLPAGGGGGTDFLRAKVNGSTLKNFNFGLDAVVILGATFLAAGDISSTSLETLQIGVSALTPPLGIGTFPVAILSPTNQNSAQCNYTNATGDDFTVDGTSAPFPGSGTELFKVVITQYTATRVSGTFSGRVGTVANNVLIQDGEFSIGL